MSGHPTAAAMARRALSGVAVLALAASLLWAAPGLARRTAPPQPPEELCGQDTRSLRLVAVNKGRRRTAFGFSRRTASIPGPTIEMVEGECLRITLVNRTDRRVSAHAHGVDYSQDSDGTPLTRSCVRPGESRDYLWRAHEPQTRPDGTIRPGSAGYWHYHDHCMGTHHGTVGINRGLFGALIVRRPGEPVPDVDPCVLVMIGTTFNLKRAPDTPVCEAAEGQRAEFVVITHGELDHTFHLHGHRWADTRTGTLTEDSGTARVIDNRSTGPGDSFGFQVVAGEGVGPGAWMYHCHVQSHSDLGMAGIFLVTEPDGAIPARARRALEAFRSSHAGHGP